MIIDYALKSGWWPWFPYFNTPTCTQSRQILPQLEMTRHLGGYQWIQCSSLLEIDTETCFHIIYQLYSLFEPSVGDPWHFGTDPDPRIRTDPRCPKTYGSGSGCWTGTLVKSHKEATKQKKLQFLLLFLLDMEGSGAISVLLTSGSGSNPGGPKTYGPGSGCVSGSPTLFELKKTESQNICVWLDWSVVCREEVVEGFTRSPGAPVPSMRDVYAFIAAFTYGTTLRWGPSRVEVIKKQNP